MAYSGFCVEHSVREAMCCVSDTLTDIASLVCVQWTFCIAMCQWLMTCDDGLGDSVIASATHVCVQKSEVIDVGITKRLTWLHKPLKS